MVVCLLDFALHMLAETEEEGKAVQAEMMVFCPSYIHSRKFDLNRIPSAARGRRRRRKGCSECLAAHFTPVDFLYTF